MIKALTIALALMLLAVSCKKEQSRPITPPQSSQSQMKVNDEINALKNILKSDPQNLNALIKLGNVAMDANKNEEAVDAYSKALTIDAGNTDVRVDMATTLRRLGRSDKAVEEFKKAIETDPTHKFARLNLGIVLAYDFMGKEQEAIKELETYLELAPNAQNAAQIKQLINDIKAKAGKD